MEHGTETWTYSHTQLALWKLCKRRYYNRYMLGKRKPTTPNMAAGTWLCQNPIEHYEQDGRSTDDINFWNTVWPNFLAEFGGDDSYKDPVFNLDLAKRILVAYKANPVQGNVVEIEQNFYKDFSDGLRYSSRPDFVTERVKTGRMAYLGWPATGTERVTWDIKLKTFNQSRAGDTFFAKAELSQFDDQCLGQSILAGAQAFGQIVFLVGKKDGTLIGPVYLEHNVNPTLAEEWKRETNVEIGEIDQWRTVNALIGTPWPKNDQACYAFGKPCHHLVACNFGFEPKGVSHANG